MNCFILLLFVIIEIICDLVWLLDLGMVFHVGCHPCPGTTSKCIQTLHVLQCWETKAESLEAVFKNQWSEVGNTRRQEETMILGYWRDLTLELKDCNVKFYCCVHISYYSIVTSFLFFLFFNKKLESSSGSSWCLLQDWIHCLLQQFCLSSTEFWVHFLISHRSTCANTIKLPISKSYECNGLWYPKTHLVLICTE